MQNKRTKRTSHKPLHLYAFGDNLNKISDKLSGNLSDKGANLLNSVGSLATGASQALTGGNSTGVGNAMNTIGSLASNIPGIGGIVGAGIETLGNLVNAAFGSNINEENVQNIQNTNMNMRNLSVDQSSFDNLLAQQASTTPLGTIDQSEVGTDGWFSNKAKNLTADLNKKREAANLAAQNAFATGAENIENSQLQGLLSNYMAKGGKIYIKPSKRGTFTAAAKKHGKGVQEFARQVLANKDKYSSAMIKKANFARNASKWHDDGGNLETLIQSINNRSNANFVKRLLDPNRSYIQDWENPTNIATHKLSYATDDGKYIVYPEVQSINGILHDYTDPKYGHKKWDSLDNAILNGDTVNFDNEIDAKRFTEEYKKYYPKGHTFEEGGRQDNKFSYVAPVDNTYVNPTIPGPKYTDREIKENEIRKLLGIPSGTPIPGHYLDGPIESVSPEYELMGLGLGSLAKKGITRLVNNRKLLNAFEIVNSPNTAITPNIIETVSSPAKTAFNRALNMPLALLNKGTMNWRLNSNTSEADIRKILKTFNTTWGKRYGYDPIPLSLSKDWKASREAIQNILNQHNTVVRGVVMPRGNNLDKVTRALSKKGVEPTEQNIFEHIVTTTAPYTGHGRASFNPKQMNEGVLYTSNSYGTALGYARPDQSGFKDRGRIAKIRFNTDFSGDDVGEWLLKNDFRPHENDFYTTYALPYLVKYGHSPSKDFRAIQKPLLDRYDNLFKYSVDYYKDIKDRIEDFRSTLPEDVAKYLPKFRRDDNIKNKIYNEMLGRHILKEIMPFSELNEIKRAIGKFNSKAAKDLRNKNFKGNYNLKTKMLWREINSGEDIREFVSQHVLPNYKNQLIKLGTSPKATNRLSSNPYQHFLKTGPIGEKVADFVEEIPLDLLDRNSLYISRGHSNKYTKGLSRKARKYGGDLYLIDEHDTVADIGMPNLYKNGGEMNTHGANFTNGIKTINEGGLHETNPLSGVPMGIAPDGEPNLVEQGEVIYNNYVYSNRLFPTKKVLQEAGLPTKYSNYSFAYIAEKLSKESEERTNDPISANGLRDNMNRLQKAQEAYKELNKIRKSSNKYSKGGHLYDGEDTSFIFTGEDGFRYRVPYTGAEPAEMELIREEPLARLKNSSINLNPNINPDLSNLHGLTTIDPKYSIPTPSERGLSQQEIDDWMDEDSKSLRRSTIGRYAPIMGSAINVLTDTLGITNKADYSNPNMIGNAASRIRNVSYTPVNNYLTYNPLDRNYYMNQLRSQAAATRRAITNQSGGNRATAMAALLAADNNAQLQAGNLARQAEEYNRAQKERVETFNRGTHQLNSEGAMRASLANQQADQIRLNAALAQAQMQEGIDRTVSANKSANTNNFLQNLSDLGRENMQYNWLQDLIDSGAIKSFRRGGKLKNRRK